MLSSSKELSIAGLVGAYFFENSDFLAFLVQCIGPFLIADCFFCMAMLSLTGAAVRNCYFFLFSRVCNFSWCCFGQITNLF